MIKYKSKERNCISFQKTAKLATLLLVLSLSTSAQNRVSEHEAVNFGTIHLPTAAASQEKAPWKTSTDHTRIGYWAAAGNAQYTGASDDKYFIDGYVKWFVTAPGQSFTAPVGSTLENNELRNLTISGSTAPGDIFATAYWKGSPSQYPDLTSPHDGLHSVTSVGPGIGSVSPSGWWDWQDFSITGAGRTITVDIPDMTSFSSAANLRLVGWNGTQWVNLSTSATASGNTNHSTLAGTMQAGITAIAIGSTSTASLLPDLTPTADIDDLSFATGQARDFTVNIFELVGSQTIGPVSFRLTRISGWDITVPGITLTSTDLSGSAGSSNVGGGTPHENDKWLFKQNSGFITATLKPGISIAGSGTATLGFTATRKSGTPTGTTQNITVTIVNGGGEVEISNNLSVTSITAN